MCTRVYSWIRTRFSGCLSQHGAHRAWGTLTQPRALAFPLLLASWAGTSFLFSHLGSPSPTPAPGSAPGTPVTPSLLLSLFCSGLRLLPATVPWPSDFPPHPSLPSGSLGASILLLECLLFCCPWTLCPPVACHFLSNSLSFLRVVLPSHMLFMHPSHCVVITHTPHCVHATLIMSGSSSGPWRGPDISRSLWRLASWAGGVISRRIIPYGACWPQPLLPELEPGAPVWSFWAPNKKWPVAGAPSALIGAWQLPAPSFSPSFIRSPHHPLSPSHSTRSGCWPGTRLQPQLVCSGTGRKKRKASTQGTSIKEADRCACGFPPREKHLMVCRAIRVSIFPKKYLHECPAAAITNGHTLGDFKRTQIFIFLQAWKSEVWKQG